MGPLPKRKISKAVVIAAGQMTFLKPAQSGAV